MGNINDKIKELNPHVLSIRFSNGITVVDCAFNTSWVIPKSNLVGFETVKEKPNYYMLYPLNENVGIDEMLDHVRYIINVNIEREKKIELLQIKIKQLKELFSKNPLDKCEKLEFRFSTDLESNEDVDLEDMPIYEAVKETVNEAVKETAKSPITKNKKVDGHVPEVQAVSQKEILEGGNNVNPATAKFNNETFDLPPKNKEGKIVVETFEEPEIVCKCDPNDPNQLCPVCIDSKI